MLRILYAELYLFVCAACHESSESVRQTAGMSGSLGSTPPSEFLNRVTDL